jgi:large subunit ribosomal protein L10
VLGGETIAESDRAFRVLSLPGKDELRAKFLATLNAVPQNFLALLNAAPQNFMYLLAAREQGLKGDDGK